MDKRDLERKKAAYEALSRLARRAEQAPGFEALSAKADEASKRLDQERQLTEEELNRPVTV